MINYARKQQINPAWVFAIIRQESAFTKDARSNAGALGLMQLLPRTARRIARTLQLRFRSNDLFDAETNVRLGINYLKRVMTYTVIYEERLGRTPVPLLERMQPIPGEPTVISSDNPRDNDAS
ncbi:MAG: transglycosylase SLT domain-containing protein [Gammaproteobacteria bacterium]